MPAKLGLNAVLYRNIGSYQTPNWRKVLRVRGVTLNLERQNVDVTTRDAGGWREYVPSLRDVTLEFNLLVDSDNDTTSNPPNDPLSDYVAFETSFMANALGSAGAVLDLLVMDAPNTAGSGGRGLRFDGVVTTMTRNEPLDGAVEYRIVIRPVVSPNTPQWVDAPST